MKKIALVAAATAVSLTAVAPALAQDVAQPAVIEIDYSDLDIRSANGSQTLAGRIQAGVKLACDRPYIRDLKAMLSWQECRDSATSQAVEQLARIGATVTVLPSE
jgi:UrcA family protein